VSLRAQLALAFFLLAVVPLAGMTVWSYSTSRAALRRAVKTENLALAEEMSGRLQQIALILRDRILRMRNRAGLAEDSPFEKARRNALKGAEQGELLRLLPALLTADERRRGELPFARDEKGQLYANQAEDLSVLKALGLGKPAAAANGEAAPGPGTQKPRVSPEDWVVVEVPDASTGLTLGIARPVGEPLRAARLTEARNLAMGLALVGVALLGILPLSRRMTHKLERLAAGVQELASGNLEARVPFRSRDEFGRLAEAFNRMALDLKTQQDRLVAQGRLRKELEMCRLIQVDLLPREPLRLPFAEIHGISLPAREVGGDFFNHFVLPGGEAALLVGDVSGKGVPAALLMANLQATLRARLPLQWDLARLASELDQEIDQSSPRTVYLTLFAGILDGDNGLLRYVNAGHNPPFLLRVDGTVEALAATGRPLGLLPGGGYQEGRVDLGTGDRLFMFTDGLVEAEDAAGEPFGLERLHATLARERASDPARLLAEVEQAALIHRGGVEAADDATLVILSFAEVPGKNRHPEVRRA
jgi:serine phosphatase RsbU (regulator of sigma subunit)